MEEKLIDKLNDIEDKLMRTQAFLTVILENQEALMKVIGDMPKDKNDKVTFMYAGEKRVENLLTELRLKK